MTERELMAKRDDATYAQQILDNPLWNRLVEDFRKDFYGRLIACPAREREVRDLLLTQLKAVEMVVGHITNAINGGRAAEIDLEKYARTEGKVSSLLRRYT